MASGDLKPKAIRVKRRTLVFVLSTSPLDSRCSRLALIEMRCLAIRWAKWTKAGIRQRLAQRIAKHRISINASLEHRLSNGLVESTNTKVRLLTRMAFGFKSPEAMIALAMLNLGGYCPPLPGRRAAA